ncbi:proteoglycan 4-like isoform X1 [Coregonus clupeaformis]|uniref:proteoglycan 4-like isoform X1 n=1 Tax=Coregonus clupeaformis TaxID=59861 RepID=UPI001E1C8603|nr:proteoglycan 4-like isoform X1 [Coregonus clupeaformis]
MTPSALSALLLLACALPFNSAQSSCSGRCGEEYYRGSMCQCDYDCLTHEECCKDYESQCTTSDSCKGRCGESFKRGRQCDCDPDCARYSKCCPDYKSQCGIEDTKKPASTTTTKTSSCNNVNDDKPKVVTTTSTRPASTTTPKTSSCDNIIDHKPKEPEPPQIQPTEEPEMTPNPQEELNEDLSDDQLMPLVTPEPELQDEQGDDVKGETWPDLPVPSPEAGLEDPEATPNPEDPETGLVDPKATPNPEDPEVTPNPEDPEVTPNPEDPEAGLVDPKPTPNPEDPEAGLVDPEVTSNPEDPEATPNQERTSWSEPSPTEPAPSETSNPTDPSVDMTPSPTDTETDPEQEAILEGDYTAFPEELDPEATPGPEGTPPAEVNLNPSLVEPAKEVPTEKEDSSVPEGQPDSSSSLSALDQTPLGSSSEPTPAAPQPSNQVFPSSEPQPGPTPAEDTLELLPEGQSELDPEGQEAESENTLPEDSEPTPSNLENAATTPAANPASTSPTQGTPSASEDPEATPASPDSTTPCTKPDQTPSAPEGATPSSEQDSPKENAPTTTPSDPQDPNAASEAPASESGPEDKPGRGDTPDSSDDSVPQTGDLAMLPTPDPLATSTDPAGHEEEGDEAAPEETTTDPMKLTPVPTTKPTPNKTTEKPKPSKPTGNPKPKPTQPSTLTDINQALGTDNPRDYQADEHDTNICSGRPVSAVTTLRNGTVVVFRGHYFWVLDSNRVPGPARGITDVWGVPSPIDTVFTRCNCQGKTYFFKGSKYWRFENGMMEPGYPKLIRVGFNGLQGQITAALSVPEYRKRRESVYFFKRGGLVQKYSYQSGTSPTCGRKVHYSVYTVRNRVARQAVPLLGQEINIRLTWRGFPSTVTSAVSIPTRRKQEGYNYYLFSRSKYYNVNMGDERPFIATPPVSSIPQKNSAKDFFNCPKEV